MVAVSQVEFEPDKMFTISSIESELGRMYVVLLVGSKREEVGSTKTLFLFF